MRDALKHVDIALLAAVFVFVFGAAILATLWTAYDISVLDVAVVVGIGVAALGLRVWLRRRA